jgi:hypothetical protein
VQGSQSPPFPTRRVTPFPPKVQTSANPKRPTRRSSRHSRRAAGMPAGMGMDLTLLSGKGASDRPSPHSSAALPSDSAKKVRLRDLRQTHVQKSLERTSLPSNPQGMQHLP